MGLRYSIVAALLITTAAVAQTAPSRVLGVVTEVSAQGIIVTSDQGEKATVAIAPDTAVRRVPAGERDLTRATSIQADDIRAGDRVLVRGTPSNTVLIARQVIVMSASDIEKKHEEERLEWTRRGVAGLVTAVDAAASEVTIRIPALTGQAQTAVIVASPSSKIRRYAPGSVKFADAKPSTLSEIKPGDQLRAKGERSADGGRWTAEEIVSGTFRTVAGTVVSSTGNVIRIKELGTNKERDVRLLPDSALKRFPAMEAAPGQGRLSAGSGSGPETVRATPPAGMRPGGPGGPGGGMRRPDFTQMLERLPTTTAADIKPGETVVVSFAAGGDEHSPAAITLLAGAERLISMQQARQGSTQGGRTEMSGSWNLGDIPAMAIP